ncbi:acyl carrier protein [Streptomyces sp. NPDC059743]|uniref:acyl carrier protein n=1 Tax=Streptomyces sp. NPDC059743 TaxID=3346928 RepID=UPI00364A3EAF
MTTSGPFTIDDLARILREGAGDAEDITPDAEFELLGYDSLAMLETYARIEREYGITLDEEQVASCRTPGALTAVVDAHLSAARAG